MRRLFILLLLSGCAPQARGPQSNPLALELAGRAAGAAQTCLSTGHGQNLRVIDARTLAYEVGRTTWINRLKAECPALNSFNAVIIEASGSEYCRGDWVRGLEPGETIAGPGCNLGDWTPYRLP